MFWWVKKFKLEYNNLKIQTIFDQSRYTTEFYVNNLKIQTIFDQSRYTIKCYVYVLWFMFYPFILFLKMNVNTIERFLWSFTLNLEVLYIYIYINILSKLRSRLSCILHGFDS